MRAFWEGDLATAKQLTQNALDVAREDAAERAIYMMRTSSLRMMESGALHEGIAMYESMLAAFPAAVGLHCALASAHAVAGDRSSALRHFDIAAQDDFGSLPEDLGWLGEMAMLAEAAVALDDRERAALVYTRLSPHSHVFNFFMGEVGPHGPVAYWLAGLATTLGDLALARNWLDVARELNQRLGATMLMHFALLVEARVLFLSTPSAAAEALALIREAKLFAEQRGLVWLAKCAEREQEEGLRHT
jgi:tetratricopeptide (TPR) repeat protein